jgi:hypothetical protein
MVERQSRCTTVTFFGIRPGVGVTTLVINVAALLGVSAHRKTLLLDLSGNERGVSSHLGISSDHGLLDLATLFLRDGHISSDDLARHVVRYEPGAPWLAGASALDILPGFDRAGLSLADKQRLHAYYGVALVKALCESACLAGYEFILADGGIWHKEEIGLGMLDDSAQAFLVSSSDENDVLSIADPLRGILARGWYPLLVFNQSQELAFRFTYGNEGILKQLACAFVPQVKKGYMEESKIRGLPAALLGLHGIERRLNKFTSGCVAVACLIDQQLKGEMRNCRVRLL